MKPAVNKENNSEDSYNFTIEPLLLGLRAAFSKS
jgi:hypothetical protein